MASLEAELRSRSDIIEGIGAITVSVDAGEHDQNALGGFQKKVHGRPVGTGTAGHPSGSVVVVVRSARRPPLAGGIRQVCRFGCDGPPDRGAAADNVGVAGGKKLGGRWTVFVDDRIHCLCFLFYGFLEIKNKKSIPRVRKKTHGLSVE